MKRAKRLVVKLGSSLLAPQGSTVRTERLRALASQVAALRRSRKEVVLVTSGAIATGMRVLSRKHRPESVEEQQALAAVGQPELMRAYTEAFGRYRLTVAQVLLTKDDLRARRRFRNARRALLVLLRRGVVPIVNENDMVAVDEIRMGDNDLLSAHITLLANADALIILTDIDGLNDGCPGVDPAAARIEVVEAITPEIKRVASQRPGSAVGSGGMMTKVQAAEIVTRAGHPVVIARGTDRRVLLRVVEGESVGTLFLPVGRRGA